MRHIGNLAGAALIVLAPTAGLAQTGATPNAPLQPGSWGQGGWQAGTPGGAYTPTPQTYVAPSSSALRSDPASRVRSDYRPLERGKHVPHAYLDGSYTVVDWNDWGFSPPGPGLRWVRYYDDGLLIDGEGRIVDARYGVDWNHARAGLRTAYAGGAVGYPAYAGGASYAYPAAVAPAYGYAGGATVVGTAPGVTTYRVGPNTTVTTAVVQAPPVIVGAPYGYAGGATVVGAPAAPVYGYAGGATTVGAPVYGYAGGASVVGTAGVLAVTTTTTTTDYETVNRAAAAPVRRARVRPIRRARPRCVSATCPVLGS